MKTSIIYLGIALLILNSSNAKNNSKARVTISNNKEFQTDLKIQDSYNAPEITFGDFKKMAPVEEQSIFSPATLFAESYSKPIELIILENNQIIESESKTASYFVFIEKSVDEIILENNQIIESAFKNEFQPLYLDRTVEDQIAEDNAIIENEIDCKAVQTLDFEIINTQAFCPKKATINW